MRILIVNSIYKTPKWPKTFGGAERSVQLLAEELAANGHDVSVIAIADEHGSADTKEKVNNVDVHNVSCRNIYWIMDGKKPSKITRVLWHLIDDQYKAPHLFEKLITEFCPDIVYTNTLMGLTVDVWRIASRHGAKIIHTLRDYYLICPKTTIFKNGKVCNSQCTDCRLLTRRRRDLTKYVDAVVGNSRFILDRHLEHGLFANALVKTSIGSISEINNLEPRERADGKVIFGYIGRFSRTKGIEQLIKSFAKLPDNAELLLAGDVDTDYARSLMKMSGTRIKFIGFVNPIDLYKRVDIVVVPSLWHEPLPRAALDSVAANRPVVGSNRGGTIEAMGEPPFGWVYDPAHQESFDEALYSGFKAVTENCMPPKPAGSTGSVLSRYQSLMQEIANFAHPVRKQ